MLVIIVSTLCFTCLVENTWSNIILPVSRASISELIGKRYWFKKAASLLAYCRDRFFFLSIASIIVGKIAVIDAEP